MADGPDLLFLLRFRQSLDEMTLALLRGSPPSGTSTARDEALIILCRLLFLSFIQSRGWLAGDRRFLQRRLNHAVKHGHDFFSTTLLPLFFGCFNTPIAERALAAGDLGTIPYLNGGLFEPSWFERRHPDLHLSNDLMRRVVIDTFGPFEFHITPEPGAACIDPEMLGRVFETVMVERERATSGSYYTPPAVAKALARSAIAERLSGAPTEAALERITILDPACGSGAILVAALDALVEHWRAVSGRAADVRRIVASSLYGVDVTPEAVRLCELRLWLAVAAAHNATADHLEPLPNLDRNILRGNSLVALTDVAGDARGEVYAVWRNGLRRQNALLDRYRNAAHSERTALRRALRSTDHLLALDLLRRNTRRDDAGHAAGLRARPARVEHGERFFTCEVHFAPVLATGGFDVVIGNPPWVRVANIPPHERRVLAAQYSWFRAARRAGDAPPQSDLSVAFFQRTMQLVRRDGVVGMLMPARIASADYGAVLRRAVADQVVRVDRWSSSASSEGTWFDADVEALAIIVRAERQTRGSSAAKPGRARPEHTPVTVQGTSIWTLAPAPVLAILQRLYETHPPLQAALQRRPVLGVKTGQNRHFFLPGSVVRADHLVTPDGVEIPLSALCRCVRGRDVQRWRVRGSEWMLWPGGHEGAPWLRRFATLRGLPPRALRLAYARPSHIGTRVAWKDIARGVTAVVMPETVTIHDRAIPLVPNQTLYSLSVSTIDEAHTIAAVLNSTIAGALLLTVAERVKDAHYRYFARTVAMLPWPNLAHARDQLARLSTAAHAGADVAAEIDDVVADAYSITNEELQQLRLYVAERLQ